MLVACSKTTFLKGSCYSRPFKPKDPTACRIGRAGAPCANWGNEKGAPYPEISGCDAPGVQPSRAALRQPPGLLKLVHPAHATAAVSAGAHGLLIIFLDVGHQGFGGEHQGGDGGR